MLERFIIPLEIPPFDADAVRHCRRIRAALKRAGTPIGGNDLLIAAHALSLGLTLVTDNRREFARVPGIACEEWTCEGRGRLPGASRIRGRSGGLGSVDVSLLSTRALSLDALGLSPGPCAGFRAGANPIRFACEGLVYV